MKRITTSLFLIAFLGSAIVAQQTPYLSTYAFQPAHYNPAAQGAGGIGIAYRSDYLGLDSPDDRPTTMLLQADLSPLLGVERIGVGVLLLRDEAQASARTQATGFFAYRLVQEENLQLSLGVMAGALNQRFDFANQRLNDPDDLLLFSGETASTKFDGGAGLMAVYALDNGVELRLDAALPQLFTSDMNLQRSGEAAVYDLLPHVLSNFGVKYRGEAFAVQPSVTYRETFGGRRQKAATMDLNLAVWFLDGERLMLGGSYRTTEGGIQAVLGVKPVEYLQITAGYGTHRALGPSFEAGLRYNFGRVGCGKGLTSEEQLIQDKRAEAQAAYERTFSLAAGIRDKIALANTYIKEAENSSSYEVKGAKTAKAEQHLQPSEEAISKIETELKSAMQAANATEKALNEAHAARRKPCNSEELLVAQQAVSDTRAIQLELAPKIRDARNRLEKARPVVELKAWVANGETEALKTYFASALNDLASKPEGAALEQVTATSSSLTLEYAFPEESEEYVLTKGSMEQARSMMEHLVNNLQKLEKEGVKAESLRIRMSLQNSEAGAKYSVPKTYGGEYGNKASVEHRLNNKAKTSSFDVKKPALTFLDLSLLKGFELKRQLSQKMGLPMEKVQVEVVTSSGLEVSLQCGLALTLKR